ncbi:hypothetical protein H072_4663 [Dactylellina haptotyla CBS 200.50]|uniref:Uncharacterized protein n=1 Tax=Dactylellina haptotyla (strain CBS 200.50) TaxID=1284197 RepID=S8AEH6_DACHA|nr:hypothetical protein H072_4663 [Dactylellina haptotyla CBS 200.50]
MTLETSRWDWQLEAGAWRRNVMILEEEGKEGREEEEEEEEKSDVEVERVELADESAEEPLDLGKMTYPEMNSVKRANSSRTFSITTDDSKTADYHTRDLKGQGLD